MPDHGVDPVRLRHHHVEWGKSSAVMRHFAVSVDVPFKFSIASFSVNIIPLQVLRHPVNISPRIAARPVRNFQNSRASGPSPS